MTAPGVRLALAIAAIAPALGACPSPDGNGGDPPESAAGAAITVAEGEVRAANGTVLLGIADVPGDIPVDRDIRFGATERFRDASLSPDGAWLAVVTSGAAHSAGWLLDAEASELFPAAFQYGGDIALGPWSADARHAVFVHEGPAGDRTLTVVDRERLGDTVSDTTIPVRIPDHAHRPPEGRIYEAEQWQDGALLFTVNGQAWRFDPATGELPSLP